jgi:putative heme-binding domain-containing protein
LVGPAYKDDVRAGYTPARDLAQTSELRHATSDIRRAAVSTLRQALTSSRGPLDREVTRTLAIFRDDSPETLSRVADRLTADSDPIDDVHYLIVLSRLAGTRSDSLTRRVAAALLALDRKCAARQLNRDRNWPFRLAELHEALAEPDPQLNRAMLDSAEFGRSDHVLWAQSAGFDRRRAAERLLARAEQDRDFEWTDGLVELLGELPPEVVRPALRRQWDSFALRDAIVHALARPAEPEDRGRFVDALDSPRWLSVLAAVEALQRLPATSSEESAELLALVRALRRFQTEPDAKEARTQIGRRLVQRTGEQLGDADAKAWTDWLTRHRPALAARLSRTSGVDAAAWRQRLARIPWTVGDAERGRQVYVRASCSACHSGARALGPDLRGAASRFSRDDLFTAILEPSRDVPPRYQATLVATQDGKQYQGAVIYDAVDSLILQTGAESVVRIANTQIAERRLSPTSLMPTGLLDMLSDAELADLYAYLRSMR